MTLFVSNQCRNTIHLSLLHAGPKLQLPVPSYTFCFHLFTVAAGLLTPLHPACARFKVLNDSHTPNPLFRPAVVPQWLSEPRRLRRTKGCRFDVRVSFCEADCLSRLSSSVYLGFEIRDSLLLDGLPYQANELHLSNQIYR